MVHQAFRAGALVLLVAATGCSRTPMTPEPLSIESL